ncbi:MAG: hypothetical protein AN487_24310, partial [Anabaena sp. CRKS33]
ALRYFEWVDQPVITDEPCIHGKKQTKNFHQELKNCLPGRCFASVAAGREGKFNIRTEELPWERSRSQ